MCWKSQERDGKTTKVPINPVSGKPAKSNDSSTWDSFETAYKSYLHNGYCGIGYVLSDGDPFIGWDFDDCRDIKTNKISPSVKCHIDLLNSYTEISPSGTGLHTIVKANILPSGGRKKGNIEVYQSGRYLTITGHHLYNTQKEIKNRQKEVTAIHQEVFTEITENNKKPIFNSNPSKEHSVLDKVFKSKPNGSKIERLYNGDILAYPSQSEADLALCSLIAPWVKSDPSQIDNIFKSSKLYRSKWDEKRFADGRTYGQATIQKAIESSQALFKSNGKSFPQKREPDLAFPNRVMQGAAGYFANIYKDYLETPQTFLFMGYLTCLGALLSRILTIKSEIQTQPRLYTVLVGESATDRKSTTLNVVTKHFENVVKEFSQSWGLGSAEGLQRLLKNGPPNGTPPGTLLVFDEFKTFVSKCRIDTSVLLPCINSLFESNRYETHTKKSSVKINDAHISMLAASTLPTYERIYNSSFIDIGFPNRIFLVVGTAMRKFSFPERVPQGERDGMKDKLLEIVKHVGDGLELDITRDARKLFHDWYMNLEQSIHSRRIDGYGHRLMMLLAANDRKSEIDIEVVKNTIALCDWQLQIRKQHDPIDADTEMAKIEEKIRRALGKGPLTNSKLKQGTNANRAGLWYFDNAIKNLQRSEEIGWDKKTNQWHLAEN